MSLNPEAGDEEDELPEGFRENYTEIVMGDAYQVAVKIKSSEAILSMIRMENAFIIRKRAQFISSAMLSMIADNSIEETHSMVMREKGLF